MSHYKALLIFIPAVVPGSTLVVSGGHGGGGGGCFDRGDRSGCSRAGSRGHHHHPPAAADDAAAVVVGVAVCVGG